jgi:hypothetical protein
MNDGIFGDFTSTYSSVQQKIKRRYRKSTMENFLYALKNLVLTTFVPSFSEIQKTS